MLRKMAKNMIKEIIILLLLTLAIILILGVLLYGYSPSSKVLPEAVSYTTPESVREELASSTQDDEDQMVMTYEITASDLKNYQRVNEYVQGKRNPFASTATSENNNSGNTTSGGQSSGNTNGNANTNTNTNEGSSTSGNNQNNTNYFPDRGTK